MPRANRKRLTEGVIDTLLFRGTATLLFIVLLLGGGGAPDPLFQGVIEGISFAWLMVVAWIVLFERSAPREAWPLGVFVVTVAIIGAIQLIPLPYSWWSSWPGRDLTREVVAAANLGRPRLPLSLDPEQTLVALISLLPGIVIALSAYLLSPTQRVRLIRVVIVVAIITAVIGAMQASLPNTPALYIHRKTYFDLPSGIFANRNFQGDFLLLGILMCGLQLRIADFKGALAARPVQLAPFSLICAIAIPFLALMTVATLSRFGVGLLTPVLLSTFVFAWRPRPKVLLIMVAVLAVVPIILFVAAPGLGDALVERFREGGSRAALIPDVWYAAMRYFPVGSGLGTFDPVFRQIESLGTMETAYLNHAHNDYLEILLETGIVGIALVGLFLAAVAARTLSVWRMRKEGAYHWFQRIAAAGLALVLLHSLVDYPLRTMTIQALFALFAVGLFSPSPDTFSRRSREQR